MIQDFEDKRANITLNQTVEILKGRKVKNIPTHITDKYSGTFKQFSDKDLRRILLSMLQ
jgi:hypothetical protein